jgi:RNA polymerase sigma-70 factor, ECF subfamily
VPQPDTDRKLVAQFLASRDEDVFRELYRRHTPALYLFAIRMLGGAEHDAEDAVQEVWIRAAAAVGRFQWASSLRTWLIGIVVNCCREILRDRAPQAESTQVTLPAAGAIDLELLIRRLPEGCREVLVLHDIEGYTHQEIGALIGIAPGTSKHHLFRARGKLREWLGNKGEAS